MTMATRYYDSTSGYDRCAICGNRFGYCHCTQVVKPTKTVSIDRQLELLEARQVELLALKARAAKFGNDSDYVPDSAILFHRTYERGVKYTWVAVKVSDDKWYLTGRKTESVTFDQLVRDYLLEADQVWYCDVWQEF